MKQTVAFLPGLLCDADLFTAQIAAMQAAGRRTHVADFAGEDQVSIPVMASKLLGELPERFSLVALSMGGYVALEVLAQAPERVERLALLDTNARADSPAAAARRRDLLRLAERGRFLGVAPRLMPLYLHESRLEDDVLTGAVAGMAERLGADVFRRQQGAILERKDHRQILAAYEGPVLVLCGRQDQVTPLPRSEEMVALAPDGVLTVIEDCGHLSTMERPEAVNAALLDWMDR